MFRSVRIAVGSSVLALVAVSLTVPAASAASCSAMSAPVLERIHPAKGTNYLTTSATSSTKMIAYGFTVETGPVFKAAPKPSSGLVTVSRLHKDGDFVFTRSRSEIELWVSAATTTRVRPSMHWPRRPAAPCRSTAICWAASTVRL